MILDDSAIYNSVFTREKQNRRHRLITKGGKQLHKDGTVGEGSGGVRFGAGRKRLRPYSASAPMSVIAFEQNFENSAVEHMRIVDRIGRVLLDKIATGENASENIDIEPYEGALIRGSIISHNHPFFFTSEYMSTPGISDGDIETAYKFAAREIRATDRWYTYSFVFGPSYQDSHKKYVNEFIKMYNSKVPHYNNLKLPPEDAKAKLWNITLAEFAAKKGGSYTIYNKRTGHVVKDTQEYGK